MKSGSELIADERGRQIAAEGYDASHDDAHDRGELVLAAVSYAVTGRREAGLQADTLWPWKRRIPATRDDWARVIPDESYKPKGTLSNLVRAGAFIAAEIDRLQRAAVASVAEGGDEAPPSK